MNLPVQIAIAIGLAIVALSSYSLVGSRGAWGKCHWFGKAAVLMLAWMAIPHTATTQPQVVEPSFQSSPLLLLVANRADQLRKERLDDR